MKKKTILWKLNIIFVSFLIITVICCLWTIGHIPLELETDLNKEYVMVNGEEKYKTVLHYNGVYKPKSDWIVVNDSISVCPSSVWASVTLPKGAHLRDAEYRNTYYFWVSVKYFVIFAIFVAAIILFVRFKRGLKRNNPFPHKSVIIVRYMALFMLIYKGSDIVVRVYSQHSLYKLFDETDYPLSGSSSINASELLLFFGTLLVAEIMSIGSKLYEENKLTI